MKISIVIPVYNEADSLGACLEAIAVQKLKPFEVIVVDNNSTDGTFDVARRFPFVRVLFEKRQGVVHARNRGFDSATGEIIGRIDADTLLPADWTTRLKAIFADNSISAVSGSAHYYDFALSRQIDGLDDCFRAYLSRKLEGTNFLWGANMAVRKSAWAKVRKNLCEDRLMHEDFDLAIHLQDTGLRVDYNPDLRAGVSSRRIDTNFLAFIRYSLVSPSTYAKHQLSIQRHMYPVILACWLGYLPGRFIYRGFDSETGDFSWARLLAVTPSRVDPTTNIV